MSDSATAPILATKFFAPRWRAGQVSRPRLTARLTSSTQSKLTLVSAPAGFGKTTLLAEYLAGEERPLAWLSLDRSDNTPSTFWTYFFRALQRSDAGVGAHAVATMEAAQLLPPIESLLATLLNEVAALSTELVLVLDDYHVVEAEPVHAGLAFLLEHLPPNLHVVIASRADPPLGLSTLRARGQLAEIRAADLRFIPDEAAAFLRTTMGLELAAEDVAALESRTEGWIAALQLAALSMQGREDVAGFIAAFTGNNRYIVDYLVEEVLRRQPEDVRTFLVRTSVLDRLRAPLCDAVTGDTNGKAILEILERANLFLVPLDDRRQWYRYHHLFADVLRLHLDDEAPELVPALHLRASHWYERNGQPADAIRSALAGGDFVRAAQLVELEAETTVRHHQPTKLVEWLRLLPKDIVRSMPELCAYAGLAFQGFGDLDASAAALHDAERSLRESAIADDTLRARLESRISLGRGYLSMAAGDADATVQHATRALSLLTPDDYDHWRATGAALLSLAHWVRGDLIAAVPAHAVGLDAFERADDSVLAVTSAFAHGDLLKARGLLKDARKRYERSLEKAMARGGPAVPAAANLHFGLCDLFCEYNDLVGASEHLRHAEALNIAAGPPRTEYRHCVARARLHQAKGEWVAALAMLDEADALYLRGSVPNTRPVGAWRARLFLAAGRHQEAVGWVESERLNASDQLEYPREYHHITLARVLIARYRAEGDADLLGEATGLLERLRESAEAGGRTGAVIETSILLALATHASGDLDGALGHLERAMGLAAPEGYIRTFIEEGPTMRDLLRRAVAQRIGADYARRLLVAFGGSDDSNLPHPSPPRGEGLAESLTPRELEILRLVAVGMQNQAIADHLVISLPTVKRHIANVYGKLDVGTRTAAVARATELKLL